MAQLGVLLTRGPVGWPGSPLVPGNSLGGSLRPEEVDNTLGDSLCPERVDNTLEHSLGTKVELILTCQRVASETANVEHKLSLNQQAGGPRRGVTDVARRGIKETKATTWRQRSSPHSAPSGKMQLTSKHRLRRRLRETCA